MRLLTAIAAILVPSADFVHAQQSGPEPIIDMHVHVAASQQNLERLERNNVVGALLIGYRQSQHQAWMDSSDISFIPSLHFPCRARDGAPEKCYDDDGTFHVDSTVAGAAFVLPDTAWLRTQVEAGVFASFGEVTAQYWGLEPTDPILEPYFDLAERFEIPVGIHMALAPPGEPYRRATFRARLGNPLLLEDLLVRHPRLRIWVMHAGHPYQEETIALMSIYPQVYVDISAINVQRILPRAAFHTYLAGLVEAGFGKRIMFGSDFTSVFEETVDAIRTAEFLSEEQKRDILFGNAARFLNLSDEQIAELHRQARRPASN